MEKKKNALRILAMEIEARPDTNEKIKSLIQKNNPEILRMQSINYPTADARYRAEYERYLKVMAKNEYEKEVKV